MRTFYACVGCYVILATTTEAQQTHTDTPSICLAVHNDTTGKEAWGYSLTGKCPHSHGILAVDLYGAPRNSPGAVMPVAPTCCPLPSSDILVGEVETAWERCPTNHIAVGGDRDCAPGEPRNRNGQFDCRRRLFCRLIDTKRFQLGQETEGMLSGLVSTYWKQRLRSFISDIPVAFRYAVGRTGRYVWKGYGCIGYPFGSILTGKLGKRCHDFRFRQLQYSGAAGDPPAGTPVKMFPSCASISSEYDSNATCSE